MGWFGRLFSKEHYEDETTEYNVEETVDISAMQKWLDDKLAADFGKIKPAIDSQFDKMMAEKHSLIVNLDELGTAQLQNPNITEREKQIMEGNRQSYISQHKQFLNMVEVSGEITCRETAQFCKNFEELLMRLSKSTAKGHMVMNEFFADYARKVNGNIKIMSDSVTKIQEILEDGNVGIETIDDLRKAVSELQAKRKLITEVSGELGILKKKLENSNFLKQKLQKSIEQLKEKESYAEFQNSNAKREELWRQLKQTDDEVTNLFSPLQKAMKKYERMIVDDAAIFTRYTENAMSALVDDPDIKILPLLDKMKSAVEAGSIELKEPEKTLQRVSELSRERLEELRDRYLQSKGEIKRIDDDIRSSNVMQELNDLQYKMEHTESQIRMLQEKIDKAQKTEEKVDVDELRRIVQEKIREAFKINVRIRCKDSQQASSSSSSE
jgi:DNA repair exonuclease SbcCD ATPase subunit